MVPTRCWSTTSLRRELNRAAELSDSLCARGGHLGLLPEQIDPGSGAFLGNFPQAFSHIGVISSGINLTRRLERENAPRARSRDEFAGHFGCDR